MIVKDCVEYKATLFKNNLVWEINKTERTDFINGASFKGILRVDMVTVSKICNEDNPAVQ